MCPLASSFLDNLLLPPQSKHLQNFSPEARHVLGESRLIRVNDRSIPDQIGFVSLDKRGALGELPAKEQDRGGEDHGIIGEEPAHSELSWKESRITIAAHDKCHPDQTNPSRVRLEIAIVWQSTPVIALGMESTIEEEIGHANDNVVDDLSGGDDVDEPGENLSRATGNIQEGKEGEYNGNAETVDWDTAFRAAPKDFWCLAL